jgi:hypothetical protein
VRVLAEFDITRPDNRVEYDIWYSSSNDVALDFMHDFYPIDRRFGSQVLMTPRFVFWLCQDCDEDYVKKHCYAGGKYCAMDSGHPKMNGRQIVMEDLRQMCIYRDSYSHDKSKFWKYIKKVHEECDSNINEDCSRFAHKELGLDFSKTTSCTKDSFNSTDLESQYTTNAMIEEDLKYWQLFGSGMFPSIVINNSTFRGQIETQAVMNAICAGFAQPPKMCKRLLENQNIEDDVG